MLTWLDFFFWYTRKLFILEFSFREQQSKWVEMIDYFSNRCWDKLEWEKLVWECESAHRSQLRKIKISNNIHLLGPRRNLVDSNKRRIKCDIFLDEFENVSNGFATAPALARLSRESKSFCSASNARLICRSGFNWNWLLLHSSLFMYVCHAKRSQSAAIFGVAANRSFSFGRSCFQLILYGHAVKYQAAKIAKMTKIVL